MAPSQAIAIYKRGRPEGINTTNLADVIIGGGPLAAEHMEEIRELFPGANCNIVYGQTEVAGVVTNFKRNVRQEIIWMYQKPGSAGTIAPDTYCKVRRRKFFNKNVIKLFMLGGRLGKRGGLRTWQKRRAEA